jgi:hypothetical protein
MQQIEASVGERDSLSAGAPGLNPALQRFAVEDLFVRLRLRLCLNDSHCQYQYQYSLIVNVIELTAEIFQWPQLVLAVTLWQCRASSRQSRPHNLPNERLLPQLRQPQGLP